MLLLRLISSMLGSRGGNSLPQSLPPFVVCAGIDCRSELFSGSVRSCLSFRIESSNKTRPSSAFLLATNPNSTIHRIQTFPSPEFHEHTEHIFRFYETREKETETNDSRMKFHASAIVTFVIVALSMDHSHVQAWGGLFNRFTPEMLSNLGYGGHGENYMNRQSYLQRPLSGDFATSYGESVDNSLSDDPCYLRKCTANEHCCPGSVCVDVDGVIGSCLFAFGLKQGELCRRDNDCETGLMCAEVAGSDTRSCQPPVTSNKQYSEECNMSGECDISRGLCCQMQRRHRQSTRKVCSYFKDPLVCIGPVATDQIKSVVQYTSGEKRITGQGNRVLFKRGLFV